MIEEFRDKLIGVLMGGVSPEREVSLSSGEAVYLALLRRGYRVKKVDVGEDVVSEVKNSAIDVAFLVLHGGWGEDGRIQAILELLKIPYTGSGVIASALAMNKAQSKCLFEHNKIPTPRYCLALSEEYVFKEMGFKFPLVVKPNSQGSTIGVSIVNSFDEFNRAVALARRYDDVIIVEDYIEGREITVGVLDGKALEVVEIIPRGGFYSYSAKYEGGTEYRVPAELEASLREKVRELAERAYQVLGCSGGARVDFRLNSSMGPFVLEVNTIPGMTSSSLLPKSALAVGIDFDELVERMLRSALRARR